MPVQPGDPLAKITINIYEADLELLRQRHGYGWSAVVRDLIHDHLHKTKSKTIEDIIRERGTEP